MSLTFNTGFKIGSKAITLEFENDFQDVIQEGGSVSIVLPY